MNETSDPNEPERAEHAHRRFRGLDAARGALLGLVAAEAFVHGGEVPSPWVEMALSLAHSLLDFHRFVATDVTRRYVEQASARTSTDDVTIASLSMIARGVSIGEASCRAFVHAGRPALGDGALARIAPLGIALADKPLPLRLAALAECAITHYEPRCRIASAAFCAAIAKACRGEGEPHSMLEAARGEIDAASSALIDLVPRDGPLVEAERPILSASLGRAESASHADQRVFPLLFEALLRAPCWEDGLVEARFLPSDASVGLPALGALLGARFGADAIRDESLRRAFGDRAEPQKRALYALADGLRLRAR